MSRTYVKAGARHQLCTLCGLHAMVCGQLMQ